MTGKHIELFLVDGEPGGLTTADVSGWTGHVLTGPRFDLKRLLARDEAQRNGVYMLLGDDPECVANLRCYIGKTESFAHRFRDHDRKKEWWDRAVIVVSRDDSFNEGHWGQLEALLVEAARIAQRCTLDDNKQTPQLRKLSEAQVSDVEVFLGQLRGVLPVLGINVLRTSAPASAVAPAEAPPAVASPTFTLSVPRRAIAAHAQVVGDEFIVLAGSTVTPTWVGKASTQSTRRAYESMRAQHDKLVSDGSIRVDGATAVLTRDVPFASPSTAGAIVTGRACNGRVAWVWDGGTYADWENREVSGASDSGTLDVSDVPSAEASLS